MLDLEVVPEQGLQTEQWELILGEKMEKKHQISRFFFVDINFYLFCTYLGMHFSQAVAIVQSQVRVIKSAHVVYNDQVWK